MTNRQRSFHIGVLKCASQKTGIPFEKLADYMDSVVQPASTAVNMAGQLDQMNDLGAKTVGAVHGAGQLISKVHGPVGNAITSTVGAARSLPISALSRGIAKYSPWVQAASLANNSIGNASRVLHGNDVAGGILQSANSNFLPDTGGSWNPAHWNNWGALGNVGTALQDPTGTMGAAMRGTAQLGYQTGQNIRNSLPSFRTPANPAPPTPQPVQAAQPAPTTPKFTSAPVKPVTPMASKPGQAGPDLSMKPGQFGGQGILGKSLGIASSLNNMKMGETILKKKDEEPILPHQQRVVDRISHLDQPGLVVMHGLGSGKTRTSIEAYKRLNLPTEVVVPAALRGNFRKEVKKWVGKTPTNMHMTSQQDVARSGLDPEKVRGKLMIVDEAHRFRNESSQGYRHLKEMHPAKRLLLTGTPIYNHPSDIAKLINLAGGETILPETRKEFDDKYIQTKKINPSFFQSMMGVKPGITQEVRNPRELQKIFHKLVDYHAGNREGFPEVQEERVNVPMTSHQQEIYKAVMRQLPWILRMKVSAGLPPSKREMDKLLPFLSGARTISNSTAGYTQNEAEIESPKIDKAVEYLTKQLQDDPDYKGVVYSNYLDNGVNQYKHKLDAAHVPYGEFTGEIDEKTRNQLVKDYNTNKIRALLLSSAGGEGLDLKGTRLVQIMEPHFNNEKIKQVIGRAARYRSHEGLAGDKQNLLVQRYLATLNPGLFDQWKKKRPTSSDEYLQNMSDDKEKLNKKFVDLIKSSGTLKTALDLSKLAPAVDDVAVGVYNLANKPAVPPQQDPEKPKSVVNKIAAVPMRPSLPPSVNFQAIRAHIAKKTNRIQHPNDHLLIPHLDQHPTTDHIMHSMTAPVPMKTASVWNMSWQDLWESLMGTKRPVDTQANIPVTPVRSSNINAIGYDPLSKTMEVRFKNKSAYRYPNVRHWQFDDFKNSESKGKFFHKAFRQERDFKKVSEDKTKKDDIPHHPLLSFFAGGTLGNIANGFGIAPRVHSGIMEEQKGLPDADSGTIEQLRKHLGIPEKHVPISTAPIDNAFYHPTTKNVTVGDKFYKPGVIAHELGHAQIDKNPVLGPIQKYTRGGVPSALIDVAGGAAAYYGTKDEDNPLTGAAKGALGGMVGHAPVLLNEMDASRRAFGALNATSLSRGDIARNKISLVKPLLSYMLQKSTMGAGIGAANSTFNLAHKKWREHSTEKTAKIDWGARLSRLRKRRDPLDHEHWEEQRPVHLQARIEQAMGK